MGVVVEQGEKSLLHPKVKVFLSTRTRTRVPPEVVDLGNCVEQDGIVKFELAEDWGVQNVDTLWAGDAAF